MGETQWRTRKNYMKVLLDTSFIVAFLFEGDVFHKEAVKTVRHLSEQSFFYTIPLVVQETATVICRRCMERGIDHGEALETYKRFLKALKIVEVVYYNEEILTEMRKNNCNLSFVDTVLLKVSRKLGARVLTFDRKLLNIQD